MKKIYLTKEFIFDAAHHLVGYNGPCKRLHGHTYKLQVTLSGVIGEDGMVSDFEEIKKIVEKRVITKLDHYLINEIISQPTAENILIWIWNKLKKELPLYELKLWETPTSFAAFRGEDNEI
jgi:6-pyruvoyltetrahydropterin/6-carboxytetrahydropterin synthase